MTFFISFFVFVFGLCFGSFLNVCIHRIPRKASVAFPASHCPHCQTPIKRRDLIPVLSYLLLGGKCRSCKSPISIRYPIVEFLTGAVWVVLFLRFGLTFESAVLIYLFTILIPILFIDLDHMIIPNGLVLAGLVAGVAVFFYNLFLPFGLFSPSYWYTPLLGMVSASGFLLLVAVLGLFIYKSTAMGMGDVKLFIPIGLVLGWKLTLVALFLSTLLGAAAGIVFMIAKRLSRKSQMPFGPYIIAGTFIAVLWGNQLIDWYLHLSGL